MTGGHTEWQVGVSLELSLAPISGSAPSLSCGVMLRQWLSKCGLNRPEAPRPLAVILKTPHAVLHLDEVEFSPCDFRSSGKTRLCSVDQPVPLFSLSLGRCMFYNIHCLEVCRCSTVIGYLPGSLKAVSSVCRTQKGEKNKCYFDILNALFFNELTIF